MRGARKVLSGVVCAVAKDGKTLSVRVETRAPHARLSKAVGSAKKYHAHASLACSLGDVVQIQESRPFSKTVRFRLLKIIEQAQA